MVVNMNKNSFTRKDRESLIEFLNEIAKHARFNNMSVDDIIKHYKGLSFVQTILLPKIDAHIMEVVEVVEAVDNDGGDK